jgi:hypothetical protein
VKKTIIETSAVAGTAEAILQKARVADAALSRNARSAEYN